MKRKFSQEELINIYKLINPKIDYKDCTNFVLTAIENKGIELIEEWLVKGLKEEMEEIISAREYDMRWDIVKERFEIL